MNADRSCGISLESSLPGAVYEEVSRCFVWDTADVEPGSYEAVLSADDGLLKEYGRIYVEVEEIKDTDSKLDDKDQALIKLLYDEDFMPKAYPKGTGNIYIKIAANIRNKIKNDKTIITILGLCRSELI